jgi:hypothetical protein
MLNFLNMKRNFFVTLVAGLICFSSPAHALVDLQTLEQGCLWQTKASSFTSATTQTFDLMGYGSVGYSSITANAFLFDYSIYAKGADATYTVVQTTRTPNTAVNPTSFNNPSPFGIATTTAVLSTTTSVTVPSAVFWPTHVSAYVKNPVWYFTSLSAAATYYIQATFCAQQHP